MRRNMVFFRNHFKSARMIDMLMRDKNGCDSVERRADFMQGFFDCTRTDSGIDEDFYVRRTDVGTIAGRTGLERICGNFIHETRKPIRAEGRKAL